MKKIYFIKNSVSGQCLGKMGWTNQAFSRRFATIAAAQKVVDLFWDHEKPLLSIESRQVLASVSVEN